MRELGGGANKAWRETPLKKLGYTVRFLNSLGETSFISSDTGNVYICAHIYSSTLTWGYYYINFKRKRVLRIWPIPVTGKVVPSLKKRRIILQTQTKILFIIWTLYLHKIYFYFWHISLGVYMNNILYQVWYNVFL